MGEKKILRERVWRILNEKGAARFPGAYGRIPNFVGAEEASVRLTELDEFKKAKRVLVTPASPQFPVRVAVLSARKELFIPHIVPGDFLVRLDPGRIKPHPMRSATIKGAKKYGEPVPLSQAPPCDLLVLGTVAVNLEGKCVEKEGRYASLLANLEEAWGRLPPIFTTVHPLQVVEEEIEDYDFQVEAIVTPEKVIFVPSNSA